MTRRVVAHIYGACAALYLLAGRWTLSRIANTPVSDGAPGATDAYARQSFAFYTEPRFWLVLVLASAFLVLRGPSRAARPLALPLFSFFCYVLLSLAWAPDGVVGAQKAYEVGLVAIATLSLLKIFAHSAGDDAFGTTLLTIFAIGFVFACLALLMAGAAGSGERVAVLGGGPNVFARTMGLVVLIALFWSQRGSRAAVMLSVASAAGILVLLSGSRGGMVALACALATYAGVNARYWPRMVMAGTSAAAIFAVVLTFTSVGSAALDSFHERVELLLIQDRYMSGREDLYASAIALGAEHPATGAGLAAFPSLGYGSYPHNLFLEVFCEQGAFGVALLLWACTAPWVGRRRRSAYHPIAIAGFALFFVAAQFSGDFYDCRAVYLFAAASTCLGGRSGLATERAGSRQRRDVQWVRRTFDMQAQHTLRAIDRTAGRGAAVPPRNPETR